MSDIERDEATAQFVPSTEGLFGQELENDKAGFTTKPRDPPPEDIDDADSVRQAASDLAATRRREPEGLSVTEVMSMTTDRPLNEARTVEQAAAEYGHAVGEVSRFAEGIDLAGLASDVDQARSEAVEGDKAKAKHFGFELEGDAKPEGKAETKLEAKAARQDMPAEDQVDAATAAAIDAVEGLDETTRQALKIPAVRAAIEQQLGEVDNARQQLATERALAQQFAQASFLEGFPELAGLPPQHLEAGLQQLAQQDPLRFQQAMGVLNRVRSLQAAAQQAELVQAQERHQQFEATVLSEDARLTEMFGGDKAAAEAANAATLSYLAEHGVPRNHMLQMFMANPVLSSAEARRTIWEAEQYRKIKEAPKAVPKDLPPVQRPGVQQVRPRAEATNISSLQKQLEGARGNRALQIAAQIKTAQRKARG